MKLLKQNYLDYRKALIFIAIPIVLQQLFLNVASLLDTLMVGQLDEASVSGVYVANQIVFVVNLLIFGATEGGSVYFCQFFGINDERNMRKCFVFKLLFTSLVSILALIIVQVFAPQLMSLYIEDGAASEIGIGYLRLISISFLPYALTQSMSTCLKEAHHPTSPMVFTLIGVLLNFTMNYLFIFGKLGLPQMGATGAAIGTISERFFEAIGLFIFLLIRKYSFSRHLFQHLKIEADLLKKLILRSLPLVGNELLWSIGQTTLIYIFTKNNAIATVSLPISSTIYNLFFVCCTGIGQAVTILVGNTLGQNDDAEAQSKAQMSLSFALVVGLVIGVILFAIAPWIASLYTGVGEEAKATGEYLIRFNAFYVVICSLTCCSFYIIRASGRTGIVFLFDSGYTWLIQIPIGFLLLYLTDLPFKVFVPVVYLIDIIKVIIGFAMIFSHKWVKNLTRDVKPAPIENNPGNTKTVNPDSE